MGGHDARLLGLGGHRRLTLRRLPQLAPRTELESVRDFSDPCSFPVVRRPRRKFARKRDYLTLRTRSECRPRPQIELQRCQLEQILTAETAQLETVELDAARFIQIFAFEERRQAIVGIDARVI